MSPARPAPTTFRLAADDPHAARAAAAAALDRGELVVVPTETVYGLAAREDRPEALARLAAVKPGRTQPYSLAVADPAQLASRLAPTPPASHRMAERWWPGPVTQVLRAREAGTLGVRVPGHEWTRALLADVGAAVVLPSANRPDAPPPRSLDAVDAEVLAAASVAVDDGRTALGDASTVVAPALDHLRVLREGVVSRADLERHALPIVLVVCSGNTCRSPMGAALLASAWEDASRDDPALMPPALGSRGAFTAQGRPASGPAMTVMRPRGLDLSSHSSRPISPSDLRHADLVLAMTRGHLAAIHDLLETAGTTGPADAGHHPLVELFDPGGSEIDDPFGGDDAVYEAVASALHAMARARVAASLAAKEPSP